MTSPGLSSVLCLYQRVLPPGVIEYLAQQAGLRPRRGIYSVGVVLWLMMVQRLQPRGTLASSVQYLVQGGAGGLVPSCKRVREDRISVRTGAYCQARRKLPHRIAEQVTDEIAERLRAELSEPFPGLEQPVLLLDGSSLQLEHNRELVEAFPPGQNQHGASHWPVVRLVAFHDVASGLAERPCWGPMYGPQAVSEQALAEQAMDRLPSGAVVMGDRNFGIFSTAWAAAQRSHPVVLRLTKARAQKLVGPITTAREWKVAWQPSRADRAKCGMWPAEAEVRGRLIAVRIGRGKSKTWLYLFTTLELSAAQLAALYDQRWNIETDLRSLKQTVRLQHLTAKTVDMMEKELLLAVSAYNLVRAVMALAARQAKIDPRQLSFTQVLNVVNCAWPRLMGAASEAEHDREFQRVLRLAAQCTLPKRKKRRTYPRAVWPRGSSFPTRKQEKTK